MSNVARSQSFDREPISATGQDLEVVRDFNAPVERLWKAWSTPELLQAWWGPEGFTSPGAKIDFRVGGQYLSGMRGPDGKEYWSTGVFREISDRRRIVFTDHFADSQGNVITAQKAGMKGEWPEALTITVKFEEVGTGKTRLTLVHEGIPSEMREECIEGWSGSFDKLRKFVEQQ